MDQETAKKLLVEAGTFVFLGVPQETQFGIDMQCWNTDEDFRGIKMIPPGLHYIHYSGVSKGTGDVSPRYVSNLVLINRTSTLITNFPIKCL